MVVAGCGTGAQLSQAVLDQARLQGVAPDLIYAVELEGYELVEQVGEADRAALKAAVAGARPAIGDGTARPAPPPSPVVRGDLPTIGDGAPHHPVGPGG